MMHIGILSTDCVREELRHQYGDYPDMFEAVFKRVDANLKFSTFDAQCALPDVDVCDAYLITGSRHSVYDDLPWIPRLVEFVTQALARDKRIVGVCFGHQLMAHYFGGRVGPAGGGWAVGVHTSRVEKKPWMRASQPAVALLSSHKDQVQFLPDGASLYASNAFCPIAGFTMGSRVITVQGHPEFSTAYASALMTLRREVLGETVYQAGMASLDAELDSLVVVGWLVDFLYQEPAA